MPSNRIAPAADALIETLRAEVEALDALKERHEKQIEAVRANEWGPLGTSTTQIQDLAATLDNLSQKSERQARLLGRLLEGVPDEPSLEALVQALRNRSAPELAERLAEAQTTVAERVQAVTQRRETLRLALEHATELNHELLMAMQEVAGTDGQTYTAEGRSEPGPPDRPFVNAVG